MRKETAKRRTMTAAKIRSAPNGLPPSVVLSADESDAEALKQSLMTALERAGAVDIDAGATEIVTTAGVQVLLAAAAARQRGFRLTACGSGFRDAFDELGLAETIASWLRPPIGNADGDAAGA